MFQTFSTSEISKRNKKKLENNNIYLALGKYILIFIKNSIFIKKKERKMKIENDVDRCNEIADK